MPTEPVEALLYRDLSRVAAHELINIASPLLQELVNYATNVFMRCQDSARGNENEDLAVLMLYLHMIEMADGVEVLLAQSCATPAEPLIRSLFEALLSITYILETDADYVQRSLTWLVGYSHNRISYYELLDPSTNRGQRFQQARAADLIAQRIQLPDQAQVQAAIRNLQHFLARPQFQTIEAEYQRLRRQRQYPQWYELFNGPRNLRALAIHLSRAATYDLLYGPLSSVAHAHDLSRFLGRTAEGAATFKRLRSDHENLRHVTVLAATFILEATRRILTKFRPSEDLAPWYIREVRERFLRLARTSN